MPPPGETAAYRPKPADFRDNYIAMGFGDELREHYCTNYRVLRRWVTEEGHQELYEARRLYLKATKWPNGAPGNRKRRYVLGQTLVSKRKVDI
ncbi:hypothetical protein WG907_04450 [Sphingobium sp. AN558]|uniref:hypothetical protein n=1 Tax=Sphingobium sp. AN558 TaxID=3133442 RepID=UPI0030C0F080